MGRSGRRHRRVHVRCRDVRSPSRATTTMPRSAAAAVSVVEAESSVAEAARRNARGRGGDARLREGVRFGAAGDSLEDEPVHWVTLGVACVLDAALLAQGALGSSSASSSPLGVVVAVLAGYVLADLGTGIFHWSVDNYGCAKTPVFGNVIAAFQGHHRQPWSITIRGSANNLFPLAKPSIAFVLFFIALPLGPLAKAFLSSFICFIVLSQHFHRLAHVRPGRLSPLVRAMQRHGLLVSVAEHNAHHRVPFNSNYCIVNGMWNRPLHALGFFPALERAIASATGVEPRCWHEPVYDEEEEPVEMKQQRL